MQTWTTVGTPFLTFRPTWPGIWALAAALALTFMLGSALTIDSPREWLSGSQRLIDDNGLQQLALLATALLFLGLLFVVAWGRVLLPLAGAIAFLSEQRDERRAQEWYGSRFLALWHPQDEPINALSGTLGAAPRIAPRITGHGWIGYLPIVSPIYDHLFAPAADEFIWSQISRRAQGNHWVTVQLTRVGRVPPTAEPGFGPIPQIAVDQLIESSSARAAESFTRLRALLETAYDQQSGDILLSRATKIVTFQELIHTSYFENDLIHRILVARWSRDPVDDETRKLLPVQNPPTPRPMVATRLPATARLNIVKALAFIAVGGLLYATSTALYRSILAPETNRYQIEQITSSLKDQASTSIAWNADVGDLLVRLFALGEVRDPVALLNNVLDPRSRFMASQALAYSLGHAGCFKNRQTPECFSSVPSLASLRVDAGSGEHDYTKSVKALALIGAANGGKKPPPWLSNDVGRDAEHKEGVSSVLPMRVAAAFKTMGDDARSDRIVAAHKEDRQWSDCTTPDRIAKWLQQEGNDLTQAINVPEVCKQRAFFYEKIAEAAIEAGKINALRQLVDKQLVEITASASKEDSLDDQMYSLTVSLKILIALGRKKEASELVASIRQNVIWSQSTMGSATDLARVLVGLNELELAKSFTDGFLAHRWRDDQISDVRSFGQDGSNLETLTRLLITQGMPDHAKGLLHRYHEFVLRTEKGATRRALALATLAGAAQHIDMKLAQSAIAEALSWSGAPDEGRAAAAIVLARIAERVSPDDARRALVDALAATAFVSNAGDRANYLLAIADRWAAMSDFRRAKRAADLSPLVATRLKAYSVILDQALRNAPAERQHFGRELGVFKNLGEPVLRSLGSSISTPKT